MSQLLYGKNAVLSAIKNKYPIQKIYSTRPLNVLLPKDVIVKIVPKITLDKIVPQNHQGYVAWINDFVYDSPSVLTKANKIVILDHIEDPQNLGSILRTCNALGFNHLVIPQDRAAQINATVLKVASGGQINQKIVRVNSLSALIIKLKKANYWIYGSSSHQGVSIKNLQVNYPLVIILGNESRGISASLIKLIDEMIQIPLQGVVESLNVGVAAGIILASLL